ncbi:MAG: hypothetical protein HIU93_15330 [Acidobacteria bacterium]|nr:hypothetical protein [Acidobacteriota bacterium]
MSGNPSSDPNATMGLVYPILFNQGPLWSSSSSSSFATAAFFVAPSNGQKNQGCSVLDPNCKKPSKLLQYVTFLGCEFNSDIEQLTDEEDAQHASQIPIVFSAIATIGGLTGKVPGWAGITGAVTGGIYTIGIAAKSNQECTESVYGH